MSNSAFFAQVEQNINILINDGEFKEAYETCIEYLKKYPDERVLIKLKSKIEEEVEAQNQAIIDRKLEELNPLEKEGKYEEVLRGLRDILKITPNSSRIKKLYKEAQQSYLVEVEKLKAQFYEKQSQRLSEILENHPETLVDELIELEDENIGNQEILKLSKNFKDKLIAKKIKDKQALLNSNKYISIDHFLEQLRRIDPLNSRIQTLGEEIKQNKHSTQIYQKDEFIYKGEKHLDTLMKLKKFDKAIVVAKEIIESDKSNKYAINTLKKAKRKYFIQTRDLAIDSIEEKLPELKQQYKTQKDQFTKV